MGQQQFAILRFVQYKGPAIGSMEAHNERTKEQYASNPDIDTTQSGQNVHLIAPFGPYRETARRMASEAKCRLRKDSVRSQTVWLCGDTRQELLDQYLQLSIKAGIVVPPGQAASSPASKAPTVRTFIENTYFPTFVARLAPKTVENYRQYIALNILPFMGDMRMDEVSRSSSFTTGWQR